MGVGGQPHAPAASASWKDPVPIVHEDPLYPVKGKAVPVTGPEGSRELRFPDFVIVAQDGGKVVSLKLRLPFCFGT